MRSWDLRPNCGTPSLRAKRAQVSQADYSERVDFWFCPLLLVLKLSTEKMMEPRGRAKPGQ